MTAYRIRELSIVLKEALKDMPVVVLSGMRQTGKSTLLQNQPDLKKRKYISFDDFNILEIAKRNPESLLSGDEPVTIDEVQRYPEILNYIKKEVDKDRKPGHFILSGSANFLLLKNISDSLAGRAIYLTLNPFSHREINGITDETPVLVDFIEKGYFADRKFKTITSDDILLGGMPSICLKEVRSPDVWFKGYEQTYLEKDIRSLSQVADLISFRHLLQLVSLRNAKILKQSELARDAKLNVVTTRRYLSLFEASYVLYRLSPYLSNKASRIIKSPKIYMSDTGLAAYLAGIKKLNVNEPLRGALVENYMAQNLMSILSAHRQEIQMSYWNIQGRYEVDFILEIGRETIAIEVKNGSRLQKNDLIGLKAFIESSPKCKAGILAYNGNDILKVDDKIWAVPMSLLIS